VYADKGLAFEVDCQSALTWRIDEGDAFEMFGNVLDNAAKWARSRVRASASADAGQLVVMIEDDGPGFTDVHSILQLHVRLDERVPGHGIGLTVVNELVASHAGELKLARGLAGGGLVEITLPAA
jgi:two-component system sensor histidine kinase PhoQ